MGFEDDELIKFTGLSKAQMIEQIAMLKYRSFSYERWKQNNNKTLNNLLIAIISIGCGSLCETNPMARRYLSKGGFTNIKKGTDGSEFQYQYTLTSRNETISMPEYVTDMLSRTSSYAIQFEDL